MMRISRCESWRVWAIPPGYEEAPPSPGAPQFLTPEPLLRTDCVNRHRGPGPAPRSLDVPPNRPRPGLDRPLLGRDHDARRVQGRGVDAASHRLEPGRAVHRKLADRAAPHRERLLGDRGVLQELPVRLLLCHALQGGDPNTGPHAADHEAERDDGDGPPPGGTALRSFSHHPLPHGYGAQTAYAVNAVGDEVPSMSSTYHPTDLPPLFTGADDVSQVYPSGEVPAMAGESAPPSRAWCPGGHRIVAVWKVAPPVPSVVPAWVTVTVFPSEILAAFCMVNTARALLTPGEISVDSTMTPATPSVSVRFVHDGMASRGILNSSLISLPPFTSSTPRTR